LSVARNASRRGGHVPDGLDEAAVDVLIADVYEEIAGHPAPTSALLDGSAAERRRRRMARRAMAAVVRSLPVRHGRHLPGEAEVA
jgi:hypothetical protein